MTMTTIALQEKDARAAASLVKVSVTKSNGEVKTILFNDMQEELTAEEIRLNSPLIVQQLANAYCDADEQGNDMARNSNYSALMLSKWYWIYKWIGNSSSLGLSSTEYFEWLHNALSACLYYRSWRPLRHDAKAEEETGQIVWMENPQYKPEEVNAADKSFNYFLSAERGRRYQEANKDKRKSNYQTSSIDESYEEDGYSVLDRAGLSTDAKSCTGAHALIQLLLNQSKYTEAVILDSIANGTSVKQDKYEHEFQSYEYNDEKQEYELVDKKATRYNEQFNERSVVKYLREIDNENFTKYFTGEYEVPDSEKLISCVQKLIKGNIRREIEKALMSLKASPELMSFLVK